MSMIHKIQSEMFTTDENKINRRLNGDVDICVDLKNNILTAVEVSNYKKAISGCIKCLNIVKNVLNNLF